MIEGRRGERAWIAEALDRGRPVVLVGPPGIGKTTLARRALEDRGPHREASALSSLRWVPFLPYRRLLAGPPPEEPEAVAARVLALDPGALLVDDLQWADRASLAVTAHLASRLPVVATLRDGDADADAVLTALGWAGFTAVAVGPLPPAASERLARALHPDLPPAGRRALVERAAGNPLLLRELAAGHDPSPTATRALQVRLAALGPEAGVAMARLAVAGRPVPPEVLGPGAEVVVAAGLARTRKGHVEVHHDLLADAVLADLADEEVAAHRRAVARHLPPAEGAHHLHRAGDRAGARTLALRAAAEAQTERDAAQALALAVACAPAGQADVALRLRGAEILLRVGEDDAARDLVAVPAARRAGLGRVERGELALAAATAAWARGRTAEARAWGEAALADLRGTRTESEVRILASSTLVETRLALDGRPALGRAREAVALADEIGAAQGYARARLASVLMTAGEPGWSALLEEVITRAERDGDAELRDVSLDSLVLTLLASGSAPAARAIARRHVPAVLGRPERHRALALVAYGALLDLLLDADRAGAEARWAPLLARPLVHRARPFLQAAVALLRADLGRHGEVAAVLDGAEQRAGPDPQWRSVVLWARADAALAAGRPGDAVVEAERTVALGVGDYPAAVLARIAGAHARRELGLPAGDGHPAPVAVMPAWAGAPLEWRGLVAWGEGDAPAAVAAFDEAARAWAGCDLRARARCLWAGAEVARQAGTPDALGRLDRAEAAATASGLVALSARVRQSLRAAGVRRSAARAPGRAGLSQREEEVLALVGAGRTTEEIARELRVAPATVERLVRSAARRLGVPTRRAAAAHLARARAAEAGGTNRG